MFTGLVEVTGRLAARAARGPGARLSLEVALAGGPLEPGESVAVDGVCLSVAAITPGGFEADASAETLARTTLGLQPVGAPLHFERALRAGSLLGGHMVSGHVDGIGRLLERNDVGEAVRMAFGLDPALARFVAEKGSIAVDGVSLTVNAVGGVGGAARFEVALIPVTLAKTKLGALAQGAAVNLEVDLVARYVARWLSTSSP